MRHDLDKTKKGIWKHAFIGLTAKMLSGAAAKGVTGGAAKKLFMGMTGQEMKKSLASGTIWSLPTMALGPIIDWWRGGGQQVAQQAGRQLGGGMSSAPRFSPGHPGVFGQHRFAADEDPARRDAFVVGVEKFCKEAGFDEEDTAAMFALLKEAQNGATAYEEKLPHYGVGDAGFDAATGIMGGPVGVGLAVPNIVKGVSGNMVASDEARKAREQPPWNVWRKLVAPAFEYIPRATDLVSSQFTNIGANLRQGRLEAMKSIAEAERQRASTKRLEKLRAKGPEGVAEAKKQEKALEEAAKERAKTKELVKSGPPKTPKELFREGYEAEKSNKAPYNLAATNFGKILARGDVTREQAAREAVRGIPFGRRLISRLLADEDLGGTGVGTGVGTGGGFGAASTTTGQRPETSMVPRVGGGQQQFPNMGQMQQMVRAKHPKAQFMRSGKGWGATWKPSAPGAGLSFAPPGTGAETAQPDYMGPSRASSTPAASAASGYMSRYVSPQKPDMVGDFRQLSPAAPIRFPAKPLPLAAPGPAPENSQFSGNVENISIPQLQGLYSGQPTQQQKLRAGKTPPAPPPTSQAVSSLFPTPGAAPRATPRFSAASGLTSRSQPGALQTDTSDMLQENEPIGWTPKQGGWGSVGGAPKTPPVSTPPKPKPSMPPGWTPPKPFFPNARPKPPAPFPHAAAEKALLKKPQYAWGPKPKGRFPHEPLRLPSESGGSF